MVIISYDIHWCSQWEPARVSLISWEPPNLGYFILGHLFPSCRMSMKIYNQHLQKKPFKSKTMWQKVTQAGTRVPRVPIFKQWTDHIYPQKRFLNPKCITHRNLRYSNLNHFKECTNHLVPLDYHPSVQTNVGRVSQILLALPEYHLGIFIWSFQGIIMSDTLTKNQIIGSHLCENQFFKKNKKNLRIR